METNNNEKPIALANGIGVVPEGLPPLPPVPEGYDCLEHRGFEWLSEGGAPWFYAIKVGEKFVPQWYSGEGQKPYAASDCYYIEAVKEPLPAAPVVEPTSDPCESVVKEPLTAESPKPEADGDGITIADYEEVLESHRALVREIDVILFGENAAKQASLCDLVGPIRKFKEELTQAKAAVGRFLSKWSWMDGPEGWSESVNELRECFSTPPAPDGWRPLSEHDRNESTPFLLRVKLREGLTAMVQVTWFQGDLYPDYLDDFVDYGDRVREEYFEGAEWKPTEIPKPPTGKGGGE